MKARQLLDTASARALRLGTQFFRWRYQLLARAFGLRHEGGAASPRGTLFVEIDGIGYGHMFAAMRPVNWQHNI